MLLLKSLKCLTNARDGSSHLSAAILSLLLPVFEQQEVFTELFNRLFGTHADSHKNKIKLRQEIEHEMESDHVPSLSLLIDQYLRPRLSLHLANNPDEFIHDFSSFNELQIKVEQLKDPNMLYENVDIKILSSLTNIAIQHYHFISKTNIQTNYQLPGKVNKVAGKGNCFFLAIASELQRQNIGHFSHNELRAKAVAYLRKDKQILKVYPPENQTEEEYLDEMSQDGTNNRPAGWATGPIIDALLVILDVQLNVIELRADTSKLIEVHLHKYNTTATRGILGVVLKDLHYNALELRQELFLAQTMSSSQTPYYHQPLFNPRQLPIFLQPQLHAIPLNIDEYSDIDDEPHFAESNDDQESLKEESKDTLIDNMMEQELSTFLFQFPNQLKLLSTQVPNKPSIDKSATAITLLKDPQASQLRLRCHDMQDDISPIHTEMKAVNLTQVKKIGTVTSWFLWAIPTLLTLGAVGIGKAYADQYKTVLINAYNFIKTAHYTSAARLLDVELKRWDMTKATRSIFLTEEEYAMGYLLSAICSEEEGKIEQAYKEYQSALAKAILAKSNFTVFIIETHLVDFVRHNSLSLTNLISKNSLSEKIKTLTINYNRGFSELYWKIKEQIVEMTQHFITKNSLSEQEIIVANDFLCSDVLFLLEHFANGSGKLFEAFCVCFQASILILFYQKNPNYLLEDTKKKLIGQLDIEEAYIDIERLICNKLNDCAALLSVLKKEHSRLLKDKGIAAGIQYIESFILDFYALLSIRTSSKILESEYQRIAKTLQVSDQQASNLLKYKESIVLFLKNLKEDFNLSYSTPNEWLDQLLAQPSPNRHLISEKTGNTMSHHLPNFPFSSDPKIIKRIQSAALLLKTQSSLRNKKNQTPLILINPNDPFKLNELLWSEPLMKLDVITRHVNTIKINEKTTPHFLLLSGFDLERKKSLIVKHIKQAGHAVRELEVCHDIMACLDKQIAQKQDLNKPWEIIFIHDLDQLNTQITGKVFCTMISSLTECKIIIIGTTKYIDLCDPLLSDIAGNRWINYSLPTQEERLQLLNFYFRKKEISMINLEHLAKIAVGYSSHMLHVFSESLDENIITTTICHTTFDAYTKKIQKKLSQQYNCTEIIMPSYQHKPKFEDLFTSDFDMHQLLNRLQDHELIGSIHTLLIGPSNIDKRTILTEIAQRSNRILISLDINTLNYERLVKIFMKINRLDRAILLLNHLNNIPNKSNPILDQLKFALKQITSPNLVIIGDARNKNLDHEILDFFNNEITMMPLLIDQFKESILTSIEKASFQLYFDPELTDDLKANQIKLIKECSGLRTQDLNETILLLTSDLKRHAPNYNGVIRLRLKDILFCIHKMKIKRKIISATGNDSLTVEKYIQKNKNYLFLNNIPVVDTLALDAFEKTIKNTPPKDLLQESAVIFSKILNHLSINFDVHFKTIHAWIEDIIKTPERYQHEVSTTTGDTFLHLLVTIPSTESELDEQVENAAKLLKESRYKRNHLHETPLYILSQLDDTLELEPILCPESLINLGTELDRIESFVKKIHNKPSMKGHFLLLDGPPGTGKTDAILFLKGLGYPVYEWVRGEENDKWVGGLVARVLQFFEQARTNQNDHRVQILFIDEIDAITPKAEGNAHASSHNKNEEITAFQVEMTKLKGQRVVLIGATNFPEKLPKPILSRAGTNRISYMLPQSADRYQLLTHFLREKQIDPSYIQTLATVSIGYSPRQLQSFVESIHENELTFDIITKRFNAYAHTLSQDFKDEFHCATIFMPSFEKKQTIHNLFPTIPELEEQLINLQQDDSSNFRKHTLIYGPPGGGKTTAIRIFAQSLNRVLISMEADDQLSKEMLRALFNRAKQLAPSIIFIDEMDRIAYPGSPHTGYLQTEMDGLVSNNIIIIGATNFYNKFTAAILSRFSCKIEIPPFSIEKLNMSVKEILLTSLKDYGADVSIDESLHIEMQPGGTQLGNAANALDLRQITAAMGYLITQLKQANPNNAMTYLRLEDICFSLLIQRIQEKLTQKPTDIMTRKKYIQVNHQSFFPRDIPANSVPIEITNHIEVKQMHTHS